MGQSLKATTNSMKQSEPQAIDALGEGWGGEGYTHLQANSITAALSSRKVLVNVDTKAFSLNVLIKYLEANASSQLVSECCFSVDKCLQQELS